MKPGMDVSTNQSVVGVPKERGPVFLVIIFESTGMYLAQLIPRTARVFSWLCHSVIPRV